MTLCCQEYTSLVFEGQVKTGRVLVPKPSELYHGTAKDARESLIYKVQINEDRLSTVFSVCSR